MALSKERKGEIALKILKVKIQEDGITLKPHEMRRSVVNLSKKFEVPENELAELMVEIMTETFELSIQKVKHFVK